MLATLGSYLPASAQKETGAVALITKADGMPLKKAAALGVMGAGLRTCAAFQEIGFPKRLLML